MSGQSPMPALVPVPIDRFVASVAAQLDASQLLGAGIGGGVVAPTGVAGAVSGSLADWRREVTSVMQFGAKGDAKADDDGVLLVDGTDDAAAFRLAFAWLAGGPGRVLELPAGQYNLASLTASLVMPTGATLRGAGMHRSRILWNDQAGFNLFVTASSAAAPARDIMIADLTVTGSCASYWMASAGGYPFLLSNVVGVRLQNICSEWSRAMGMALRNCDDVVIEQPLVRFSAFDGISVTACAHVSIVSPVVEWTDDDAISWHSDTNQTVPHGTLVVTGFRLRGTGGGINALGAKLCVISDGVMELVRFQGISVGGAFGASEGRTSLFGVTISNVVIRDMLDAGLSTAGASGCRALCINSAPIQAGNLASVPGTNAPGSATMTALAGYVDGNGSDAATPIAIGSGVVVSNVMVLTGRGPVAAYSQFGFGALFTRHGWVDPPVPQAMMQPTGLVFLQGVVRDVRIDRCQFEGNGGAQAIFLGPGVRLLHCVIDGCTFRDFSQAMLSGNGVTQDIRLSGGLIDLDPYLTSVGRATKAGRMDGSWVAMASAPAAIVGVAGVLLVGVSFRNLAVVASGVGIVGFDKCWLHCLPAAAGYDAGNKGIGTLPNGGEGFAVMAEDADPGSATFGQALFVPTFDCSARPAMGWWLEGQFVRNSAPVIAGGKVLLGWVRLTTGGGNNAGTDWTPAFGATA